MDPGRSERCLHVRSGRAIPPLGLLIRSAGRQQRRGRSRSATRSTEGSAGRHPAAECRPAAHASTRSHRAETGLAATKADTGSGAHHDADVATRLTPDIARSMAAVAGSPARQNRSVSISRPGQKSRYRYARTAAFSARGEPQAPAAELTTRLRRFLLVFTSDLRPGLDRTAAAYSWPPRLPLASRSLPVILRRVGFLDHARRRPSGRRRGRLACTT